MWIFFCNDYTTWISNIFCYIHYKCQQLANYHVLLWIENVPRFGVSSNEVIENFVNKYLTMDETILKRKYS